MKRVRYLTIALAALLGALAVGGAGTAQAGGGCHMEGMTDATGTTVRMQGACFTPTVLRVEPGDRVRWTNIDTFAHAVTGAGASWGDYTELGEGQSVSHEFPTAGVYPYFCMLHTGMIGAIVVGDGGAAAQTSVSPAETADEDANGALVAGVASGGGLLFAVAVGGLVYAARRR